MDQWGNTGTIRAQSVAGGSEHQAALLIDGAGVTLSGQGIVMLKPGGNQRDFLMGASASVTAVLHNVDNMIEGAGTIGTGAFLNNDGNNYLLALDNEAGGTIKATDAMTPLVLTNLTTFTNAGTVTGAGAAGLQINNSDVFQTGGAINTSGAGSPVALNNTNIIGRVPLASNGGH